MTNKRLKRLIECFSKQTFHCNNKLFTQTEITSKLNRHDLVSQIYDVRSRTTDSLNSTHPVIVFEF